MELVAGNKLDDTLQEQVIRRISKGLAEPDCGVAKLLFNSVFETQNHVRQLRDNERNQRFQGDLGKSLGVKTTPRLWTPPRRAGGPVLNQWSHGLGPIDGAVDMPT